MILARARRVCAPYVCRVFETKGQKTSWVGKGQGGHKFCRVAAGSEGESEKERDL